MADNGNLTKAILALRVGRMYALAELRQRLWPIQLHSRATSWKVVRPNGEKKTQDARMLAIAHEEVISDTPTMPAVVLIAIFFLITMLAPQQFWAASDFNPPYSILSQLRTAQSLVGRCI